MKQQTISQLLFPFLFMVLCSCSKKEVQNQPATPNLPVTPYTYTVNPKDEAAITSWLNAYMAGTVTGNQAQEKEYKFLKNSSATLGRVIFYDNLSSNFKINCNSCHVAPVNAGGKFSFGAMQNAGYVSPVANNPHAGTGLETLDKLVTKLASRPYYATLFKDAYGNDNVTPQRITSALAQYMAAMVAAGSQQAIAADPRFADPFIRQ